MKIVCVGDCGIDQYLPADQASVGGISANFARHALSAFPPDDDIQLISAIGNDAAGQIVYSALRSCGLHNHITRLSGATPIQFIELEPNGERNFVRYEAGVLPQFKLSAPAIQLVQHSELLVVPVYSQIIEFFDTLMSIPAGGLTTVDFSDFGQHPSLELLEQHLHRIDIAFFGLTESDSGLIETLRSYTTESATVFVITLGADGSTAYRGGQRFYQSAQAVPNVIDTTGAGDAFAAGFLGQYCHDADIPTALAVASKLAAAVVQKRGSGYV